MLNLKIGIQLASLRLPFEKALRAAAEMGAEAVEIDGRYGLKPAEMSRTGIRHLKNMLDTLNLRVCAIGFRTRRGYNVLEDLDARVEATKQAMSLGYQLGASIVVNQIGHVATEKDDPSRQLLIEVLTELGKHGQKAGAFLAAETGNESGAELADLVTDLPEGSLAVALNPGNLIIRGLSASEAAQDLGNHIQYVRAKDGVRDLAQGRGLEVALGRGTVDWPEVMGLLEDHNYRGYFTLEREQSNDPLTEIAAAMKYLRNL